MFFLIPLVTHAVTVTMSNAAAAAIAAAATTAAIREIKRK